MGFQRFSSVSMLRKGNAMRHKPKCLWHQQIYWANSLPTISPLAMTHLRFPSVRTILPTAHLLHLLAAKHPPLPCVSEESPHPLASLQLPSPIVGLNRSNGVSSNSINASSVPVGLHRTPILKNSYLSSPDVIPIAKSIGRARRHILSISSNS